MVFEDVLEKLKLYFGELIIVLNSGYFNFLNFGVLLETR